MLRKRKNIIHIAISLTVILGISVVVAMDKFSVYNPISALYGLSKITFTDTEHVEIENTPKVVIAKAGSSLLDYMDNENYTHLEEEQLGALLAFENNVSGEKQEVFFSANRYYSLWKWVE